MIKTANLTSSVSRNAGGLYESVRRLVQSLAQTGMEVRVFGTEDEHTAADIGAWAPVPVKAFRPIGPHQFGYSPQFRRTLEEFSPDLVHTHGLWVYSSVATNHYRRRRGVPYVISAHGMLDPWAVRNSRWKKAVAHFFYEGAHLREAGCLRALCEPEARAIRELGLKNPIAIIPNGIDIPIITNAETLKAEILKSEGQKSEVRPPKAENKNEFQLSAFPISAFEKGRKTLLYLGRIHPKKGLVNLLKAWAAVQKSESGCRRAEGGGPSSVVRRPSSEWTLAIAGWDQDGHEAELKRLATELGIGWADVRGNAETLKPEMRKWESAREADLRVSAFQLSAFENGVSAFQDFSVLFLGPQFNESKTACYENCDAFILPSLSEGLPMVVLEAWAHGKPVLMTPECNLPEGFAANAAIRVEPNAESLAQGLDQLFRSTSSDLRSLGINGRALVAGRFTWPGLGREMAGLYQWLLGGGPKPGCVV